MDTQTKPHITPKDFFIYFGNLITLYASVISLITLLFTVINRYLPDTIDYYVIGNYSSSIRFALANLFVIFPVYLILSDLISKDLEAHPEKQQLSLRKWMMYVHVFIANIVIISSLVTLINYFLGGELTARFILKVLTLVVIAGGMMTYYVKELRAVSDFARRYKLLSWISSGLVALSIILGFMVIGLPANQRNIATDGERVNDLQNIQNQIEYYYSLKNKLPEKLEDLNDGLTNFTVPIDPETRKSYVYKQTDALQFTLCAEFVTEYQDGRHYEKTLYLGANWNHDEGEVCFERTIDPELYPTPTIKK